jgi:hypothetical protein
MSGENACLVCGAAGADVPAARRLPFGSNTAVEFLAQFCVIDADVFRELQTNVDARRVCKACDVVLTDCDSCIHQLERALETWRREMNERRVENEAKSKE